MKKLNILITVSLLALTTSSAFAGGREHRQNHEMQSSHHNHPAYSRRGTHHHKYHRDYCQHESRRSYSRNPPHHKRHGYQITLENFYHGGSRRRHQEPRIIVSVRL